MPCGICNNYLMCVPVRRRYTQDPIVQNLEKCRLMKVLGYKKMIFLCNECVFAIEQCAERMELLLFRKALFSSEYKQKASMRCLICATYNRVEIFKISEADNKNYIIKELLGKYAGYDQIVYACDCCMHLIERLDNLTKKYFQTESEIANASVPVNTLPYLDLEEDEI